MEQKRNKFDDFVRRPSLKIYMVAIVALILGGVFLKDYFSTPHIRGAEDLETIDATLKEWYRADMTNGAVDFRIEANEYKAGFKVHGKFFGFSYLQRFQSEMEEGDPFKMRIPKYDHDKLQDSTAEIYPVGIWDEKYEYVEKDKALEREMRPGDMYMGLGSIGVGVLVGLVGWLIDRKRRRY